MSYAFVKIAIVGGATATIGGGIIASTLVSSEAKDNPTTTYNKTSNHIETEEILPQLTESLDSPKAPACTIYEAKERIEESGSKKFKELLKKFSTREEFFKELESRPSSGGESFKTEIDNACNNQHNKRNVNGNVYVWYGKLNQSQTWIYSLEMNNQTDWVQESGVTKTFETQRT
ncbi:hypothetical protein HF1_10750 [Mycoplasma haemofelis str. Langford 1]|uniref:Uncharacterized protein n=1 Tax=Mycoplasma haemofelis (strain Langford 1) TaxID=941640 RepID=E8ZIW2_MYCHL|nr:hypothetical protein [Mycoplasma haemofelis]CBY93083.1 hypothetical protein HF1_10750 [Mycoplasma haemofelis str. Langford 1]